MQSLIQRNWKAIISSFLLLSVVGGLFLIGGDADAAVRVRGYFRKNGTYVQPHYRSNPDGNPYNNWSFPGNINPYTGKVAPGNPDTYLKNYYNNDAMGNIYNYPRTTYYLPDITCPLNSSKIGNQCVCNEGYLAKNGLCITHTEDCIYTFGPNTYGLKGDSNNSFCYCENGHEWNSTKTGCIKKNGSNLTVAELQSQINALMNQLTALQVLLNQVSAK